MSGTTTTTPPAGNGTTTPPEGTPPGTGTPPPAEGTGTPPPPETPESKLEATLESERAAHKATQRQLREMEAAAAKAAEAALPELERTVAEAKRTTEAEVVSRFQGIIARQALALAATNKLGDPSDAGRFIDISSLEVDPKTGEVKGDLAKLVADLIKARPYLAKAADEGDPTPLLGGGDRQTVPTGDINATIRALAGRTTISRAAG